MPVYSVRVNAVLWLKPGVGMKCDRQERNMRVSTEIAQPCEAGAVLGLEAEEKPRAEALAGHLVKESPSVELRL